MISTPLVNLQNAMQQRPNGGSAAIVLLSKFKGESARHLGEVSVITGRPTIFGNGLLWDRSTQGGRCRRNLAPT